METFGDFFLHNWQDGFSTSLKRIPQTKPQRPLQCRHRKRPAQRSPVAEAFAPLYAEFHSFQKTNAPTQLEEQALVDAVALLIGQVNFMPIGRHIVWTGIVEEVAFDFYLAAIRVAHVQANGRIDRHGLSPFYLFGQKALDGRLFVDGADLQMLEPHRVIRCRFVFHHVNPAFDAQERKLQFEAVVAGRDEGETEPKSRVVTFHPHQIPFVKRQVLIIEINILCRTEQVFVAEAMRHFDVAAEGDADIGDFPFGKNGGGFL